MLVDVAAALIVIVLMPAAATMRAPVPLAVTVSAAEPAPNGATACASSVNDADPVPDVAATLPRGGAGRRCGGSGGGVNRDTGPQYSSHTSIEIPMVSESAGAVGRRITRKPVP